MQKYDELKLKVVTYFNKDVLTLSLEDVDPGASDDAVGDFEW